MCHVEVDGATGVKSCVTPLAEDMRIRRQDYKPFYGPLMTWVLRRVPLPAGFYYRMFTRPSFVRRAFIEAIRRMAGVGKIDHRKSERQPPPHADTFLANLRDRYDVVVVGAGVSGAATALAAAGAGADVLLVDEYANPGGHAIGHREDTEFAAARDDLIQRVEREASVTLALGTTAQGLYTPDRLLLGREGRRGSAGALVTVSASTFVFATGAQDVVPLFENNDLPGVFGARGARLFLERDRLVFGRTAVVYGAGPEVSEAAGLLRAHNIAVKAVVVATPAHPAGLPADTRVYSGAKLVRAEGREWISRAVFLAEDGNRVSLPCDALCIAGPGQPAFELAHQAGFHFAFAGDGTREDLAIVSPTTDVIENDSGSRRYLVGEASGRVEWKDKIDHATAVGTAAAQGASGP
jgi:sarcosine oxidase subunit alpha